MPKIFIYTALFLSAFTFSQNTIKGKVTANNEVLAYANIYIKGTTLGTTTDDTGYFQIKLNSFYDSISTAYLGYNENTIALKKIAKQNA